MGLEQLVNLSDPRLRRWAIRLFKLLLLALVAWGIHSTLYGGWRQLQSEHWKVSELRPAWIVNAAVLYLLGQLGPGWFWWKTLGWLGQPAQLSETVRAYYIGHMGKYAPGKAMVIVIRAGLLRAGGTTATAATVAVFFETLTTMGVGAAMAVIILAVRFTEHRWMIGAAGLLWLIVSGPSSPAIFRRLVRFTGAGKLDPAMADRLTHLRYRSLVWAWLPIAAGWVLMGLSLSATARAAGFHSSLALIDEAAFCTAAVAMAVVGGFLSFVPGGLGVREAALLELLTPCYGADGALIVSIVSRLAWIVAELAISGVLYLAGRGRPLS